MRDPKRRRRASQERRRVWDVIRLSNDISRKARDVSVYSLILGFVNFCFIMYLMIQGL